MLPSSAPAGHESVSIGVLLHTRLRVRGEAEGFCIEKQDWILRLAILHLAEIRLRRKAEPVCM